jgi:hypothetical protein
METIVVDEEGQFGVTLQKTNDPLRDITHFLKETTDESCCNQLEQEHTEMIGGDNIGSNNDSKLHALVDNQKTSPERWENALDPDIGEFENPLVQNPFKTPQNAQFINHKDYNAPGTKNGCEHSYENIDSKSNEPKFNDNLKQPEYIEQSSQSLDEKTKKDQPLILCHQEESNPGSFFDEETSNDDDSKTDDKDELSDNTNQMIDNFADEISCDEEEESCSDEVQVYDDDDEEVDENVHNISPTGEISLLSKPLSHTTSNGFYNKIGNVSGVKRTYDESTPPRKEQKTIQSQKLDNLNDTSNIILPSNQSPISLPIPSQPQLDSSEKQPQDKPTKTAWHHAKEWFDLGFIVVPLHSKGDGSQNDGKYPCVKEWQKTTLEQSKMYLAKPYYKKNNWGLLTGKVNGLWVVDLDLAKNNQLSGIDYVMDFMNKYNIQCNYMVETGSKGYHLYFKWDEQKHLSLFAGLTIEGKKYGIDVRSDGGQIVLPGSLHYKTGNYYKLIQGKPDELQVIDERLFNHLKQFSDRNQLTISSSSRINQSNTTPRMVTNRGNQPIVYPSLQHQQQNRNIYPPHSQLNRSEVNQQGTIRNNPSMMTGDIEIGEEELSEMAISTTTNTTTSSSSQETQSLQHNNNTIHMIDTAFNNLDPEKYFKKVELLFQYLNAPRSDNYDDWIRPRSDNYDDWIRALIFLKNSGENFKEIARDFSNKSSKYDEQSFEEKWQTVLSMNHQQHSQPNKITLGTFYHWLKSDYENDPEKLKEILENLTVREQFNRNRKDTYTFDDHRKYYEGKNIDAEPNFIPDLKRCFTYANGYYIT